MIYQGDFNSTSNLNWAGVGWQLTVGGNITADVSVAADGTANCQVTIAGDYRSIPQDTTWFNEWTGPINGQFAVPINATATTITARGIGNIEGANVTFDASWAGSAIDVNYTFTLPDFGGGGASGASTLTTNSLLPMVSFDHYTGYIWESEGAASYTVRLTSTNNEGALVVLECEDGSARAFPDYLPGDYVPPQSILLGFAPGVTERTFTVAITDDATQEWTENFRVNLAKAVNATIGFGTADTNIIDNDAPPVNGNQYSNTLNGTGGNDVIDGGLGADIINGGDGDDLLLGGNVSGDGNDTINGGGGNDLIYGNDGADTITGGTGNDTIYGNTGNDNLFGNQGADVIYGGQGGDAIFGGQDDDILYGNLGDDNLQGNNGNDTLYGGQNNDILGGGAGNDYLVGGLGGDQLTGGTGNDSYAGGDGADSFRFGDNSGTDTIYDFNPAAGDTIMITQNINGTGIASGSDALAHLTWAAVSHDLILDLGSGNTVTLVGVSLASLSAANFVIGFVPA